jgi:hypothetical protein
VKAASFYDLPILRLLNALGIPAVSPSVFLSAINQWFVWLAELDDNMIITNLIEYIILEDG